MSHYICRCRGRTYHAYIVSLDLWRPINKEITIRTVENLELHFANFVHCFIFISSTERDVWCDICTRVIWITWSLKFFSYFGCDRACCVAILHLTRRRLCKQSNWHSKSAMDNQEKLFVCLLCSHVGKNKIYGSWICVCIDHPWRRWFNGFNC